MQSDFNAIILVISKDIVFNDNIWKIIQIDGVILVHFKNIEAAQSAPIFFIIDAILAIDYPVM